MQMNQNTIFNFIWNRLELRALTEKRPDGMTVLPYSRRVPMAWDAAIVHTCAPSYLHATASSSGAAAAAAEDRIPHSATGSVSLSRHSGHSGLLRAGF